MFYGANLHVNSMNVYMCDRHWQYSCLRHMKWALKWTILLTSILEPNFDIYSLVTYILLLKIFSAKLLFIFKNLIRISMVYLPVHRSLKSWVLRLIARWLEISFPKFNRHEYYTAVSYIIRLGNVRTFKIIWSSKENMVQFFRNQGQRSKNIFHTKIHWIPNFN